MAAPDYFETLQVSQYAFHFVPRQNRRQFLRPLRTAECTDFAGVATHHVTVQEYDGVQGLILRRRRDSVIHRQMRQECPNLSRTHFHRVPLVVKQDEPLDPGNIGLLRAISQMFDSAGVGDLVKKPGFFSKSLRLR